MQNSNRQVDLNFDLNEDVTHVTAKLAMTPNHGGAPPPLVLHGRKDVKLVSLKVAGACGGRPLGGGRGLWVVGWMGDGGGMGPRQSVCSSEQRSGWCRSQSSQSSSV